MFTYKHKINSRVVYKVLYSPRASLFCQANNMPELLMLQDLPNCDVQLDLHTQPLLLSQVLSHLKVGKQNRNLIPWQNSLQMK